MQVTTPAWRAAASQTAAEPAMAPVCDAAALLPNSVSPARSTTTGLTAVVRLATSRKRRPSSMPSM